MSESLVQVATRARLEHQVQGNGWRVRTGCEEWVTEAEAGSSPETTVGTDEVENGGTF